MANKILKGINFPGLDDTYVVPQTDDCVKYSEQATTDEQKEQARKNIGAPRQTNHGLEVYSAQNETWVEIEAYSDKDNSGYTTNGKLRFIGPSDSQVILTGVEPGRNDNDAATVGQLNSLIKVVNFTYVPNDDGNGFYICDISAAEIYSIMQKGTICFARLEYDMYDDNEAIQYCPMVGYDPNYVQIRSVLSSYDNVTYAYCGNTIEIDGVTHEVWAYE